MTAAGSDDGGPNRRSSTASTPPLAPMPRCSAVPAADTCSADHPGRSRATIRAGGAVPIASRLSPPSM
ncbi:hypothetical protein [Pseudolysinimonas kribbensis]|uniref:hypothetical protein n=1 Tax=Pseudolysinimonas kribbensis TaxID=433641 RepID=UPI0024E08D0E|nr:hypothetical protein [Pseudolysinimonas kribbensis]